LFEVREVFHEVVPAEVPFLVLASALGRNSSRRLSLQVLVLSLNVREHVRRLAQDVVSPPLPTAEVPLDGGGFLQGRESGICSVDRPWRHAHVERLVDDVVSDVDFGVVGMSDPQQIFIVLVVFFWRVHHYVVQGSAHDFVFFWCLAALWVKETVFRSFAVLENQALLQLFV